MQDIPHRLWPDAEDYRYLECASRNQFAWEWLRRDQNFRRLTPSVRDRAERGLTIIEPAPALSRKRWGCLFIEDPHVAVPDIPMLWSSSFDTSVLRVEVRAAKVDQPNSFDIDQYRFRAVLVKGDDGGEHCLIFDSCQRIHLHVIAGTLLEGPVQLSFDIGWSGPFEPAISTLRRFLHLC